MKNADTQPVTNTLVERQFREAIDVLQQRGIDISTIVPSVSQQRIVELVFTGSLGKIPRTFDLGRVINYLRLRKRLLALWALEQYPDNVKVLHCKRGKYRLQFVLPRLKQEEPKRDAGLTALGYLHLETVNGSKGTRYCIYADRNQIYCTCPSASFRDGDCKHVVNWKSKHQDWMTKIAIEQVVDPWAEFRSGA